MDRHCRACPAIQARLASDVLRKMVKLCAILNFGDRSLRSPLWYGSPGRPPWPGLLFNSSQIFPSLRSNPQRLFAMDGGSDGAPSPSPVPALGTRSPAPPCGASLFWEELKRGRSVLPPPCGEVGAQLRSSSEAVAQTRLRAGLGGETSIPSKMQTPPRRRRARIGAREPTARRRVIQAEDRLPSNAPIQVAGPESCVSVEKPRHCPGASSLLRRTVRLLARRARWAPIADPSVHGGGGDMPGDPKECREHARRCAQLAKAATTPKRASSSSRCKCPGSASPPISTTPKPSSMRSTRWTPSLRSRPRSSGAAAFRDPSLNQSTSRRRGEWSFPP